MIAVAAGNCELADLLLKHHADIDKEDKVNTIIVAKMVSINVLLANLQDGYTPLMTAIVHDRLNMVQLLLERSANVHVHTKVITQLFIRIAYSIYCYNIVA